MFSQKWKILTIGGIPVYIASSWVWIAVLYTGSFYFQLTQGAIPMSGTKAIALALLSAALFFGAVLVHEGAHAVVARAFDLPVAGITLIFWGGYTETNASKRGPRAEFLVSAAGPASTVVLAGLFWALSRATESTLSELFGYLGWVNAIFAGLNALPGFPLDGGRMLLAGVWAATKSRRTAFKAAAGGGLVVGGALGIAGFASVHSNNGYYFFLFYIAFIMIATARQLIAQGPVRDRLARGHASDAMRPPPPAIPADASLSHALDMYLRSHPTEGFPVVDGGKVVGTVSLESARRVGARDPMRPVRDGLVPLNLTPVITPQDPLDEVRDTLSGRDGLVLRDGVLIGAISMGDIQRWFNSQLQSSTAQPIPPRPDL